MPIGLSDALLSRLPIRVQAFEALSCAFEDATHEVYRLQAAEGAFALKLLRAQISPFWQGMEALFGVQLAQQVAHSSAHYRCAAQHFMLQTPSLIACAPADIGLPAYTLTSWLQGEPVDAVHIPSAFIERLALADAQRHQKTCATWGTCFKPRYKAHQWLERLQHLLPQLDSATLSELALVDTFVPMVMDMRWDQCLQHQGQLCALVDVDAIVFAPKALELVMLEYWLNEEQLALWARTYQACGGLIPNLSGVRGVYRRLLWSWQLWGGCSEQQWLARKPFFV